MATFWRGATPPRGPSNVQRLRQTEKAWQAQVVALAQLRGWTTHHHYDSRKSSAGWPDLVCCRPPRLVLIECKTETGTVSPAQRAWLDALAQCPGVTVLVARPSDWALLDALLA